MGSKGSSRHKKRLSAPIIYPIKRKHGKFTIRPHPTRGTMESAIPLGIIMREILGYGKTLSEVKRILARNSVKIDGKIQTSYKFSVGPMDIVEIPKTNEYFRFTPYRGKRRFKLHPISENETSKKLLQIIRKQTVKGRKIQLTFHDGRNHLLDPEEKHTIPISDFSIKDSVLFNLETKTIEEHYPFAVGNIGIIMGGHNIGVMGKLTQIEAEGSGKMRSIALETEEEEIKTTDKHIFIIGQDKPVIEIPQAEKGESNET
jgi:small subunit ribosomal protein S4e